MASILRDNDADEGTPIERLLRMTGESPEDRERGLEAWAERNGYLLFPPFPKRADS
jgi:hypothetical protein